MIKIGTLANESGVSIRTLRYYEEIELLIPTEIKESGYRLYSDKDALRLQQILFYKELGYKLSDIKNILDDKNFDLLYSLEKQKMELMKKQELFIQLIKTVDKTILKLKEGIFMNVEDLYEGFPETKEYREEAISRWGNEVQKSESSLMKMRKEDFKELTQEFNNLWNKLANSVDIEIESEQVQSLIHKHLGFISVFWGVEVEEITDEQYLGLANLYIDDKRFTTIDGIENPKMGEFLKRAMEHYIDNNF